MIRSAASLARRVAGVPGRLARGLAVLAALAAAGIACATIASATIASATASSATVSPATTASAARPACAVAAAPTTVSAAAPAAESLDGAASARPSIGAIDVENPAELGLPRAATESARPGRASAAALRAGSETIPASAPGGAPLRPPRLG